MQVSKHKLVAYLIGLASTTWLRGASQGEGKRQPLTPLRNGSKGVTQEDRAYTNSSSFASPMPKPPCLRKGKKTTLAGPPATARPYPIQPWPLPPRTPGSSLGAAAVGCRRHRRPEEARSGGGVETEGVGRSVGGNRARRVDADTTAP
jgi:hypothetical protein